MQLAAFVLGAAHAAVAQEINRTVLPIRTNAFSWNRRHNLRDLNSRRTPTHSRTRRCAQCSPGLARRSGLRPIRHLWRPHPHTNPGPLAAGGLRYTRFHVTALCSPTRAALLTGRNHHAVGMGVITNWSTDYPGYNSSIPKSAALVSEVLRDNGYATAALR